MIKPIEIDREQLICAWHMTEAERTAQMSDQSHGICSDCFERVLAEYAANKVAA